MSGLRAVAQVPGAGGGGGGGGGVREAIVTTHVPSDRCPFCGYTRDMASSLTGCAGPEAGDVSVCLKCAGVGVLDGALSVRLPTSAETEVIESDQEIQRVRRAVRQVGLVRRHSNN